MPGPDPTQDTACSLPETFRTARQAQRAWAEVPVSGRVAVLRRFRHALAREAGRIAGLLGRPPAEALASQIIPLADAARFLESKAPSLLAPRRTGLGPRPFWLLGVRPEIHREPWGVVLILAPSNYHLFLPGTQAIQALAAGNAVLLKPSPEGRAAAGALHELLAEAGLPPALLQILPADNATAEKAVELGPDRIVLTGSSETGRRVLAAAAQRWIPCTAELSGSDTLIARNDADPARIADALVFALRLHDGATCIAPRTALLPRTLAPEVRRLLLQRLGSLAPTPLAPARAATIAPWVGQSLAAGARLLFPAAWTGPGTPGPWILDRVPADAPILDRDLFAPVIALVETASDDDAVAFVARSRFGLGASVFGRDEAAARALAARLPVGVVTLNDLIVPTADPRIPFGGRGGSGYGVTRGAEGLLELTRPKTITVRRGSWLPHLQPPRPTDAAFLAAMAGFFNAPSLGERLRSLARAIAAARPTPAPRSQPLSATPTATRNPDWSVPQA